MNIYLLKKYKKLAQDEYKLKEIIDIIVEKFNYNEIK